MNLLEIKLIEKLRSMPSKDLVKVKSSNVAGLYWEKTHDDNTGMLLVEFVNSSRYVYMLVPESEYEKLLNASSVGSFLYYNIKGNYGYQTL